MILDIIYLEKAPEQIQNVRRISVYPRYTNKANPEIVIHSKDYSLPQLNIELGTIERISITED